MSIESLPGLDAPDVLRTADISEDGLYRWRLMRIWGSPRRLLTFIMLNPSAADALKDDPTIRRCMGFARSLDFEGIQVVNLYAFRATKPVDLWTAADPIGRRNNAILREVLTDGSAVIAAWGAHARPARVEWVLRQPGAADLSALHVTKHGAPGHPLYLPSAARPVPWSGAV